MFESYFDAGLKIFGIHSGAGGVCACGNPECKALFKHPMNSNWQHTPNWSEEQFETMCEMGAFDSGFGVLVSDLLVVDVDARNGGVESFKKLAALIPSVLEAGFVVNTGSGGGSQHYYFKLPEKVPMVQTHREFVGIDFKTSGYVVGAGSMHASGALYETEAGSPEQIENAPNALIELLRKPERHRATIDGAFVDVSDDELAKMLSYVDPSCDHETWIRCGMAIHHATQGSGFNIWNDWSSRGDSYPSAENLMTRWQSFGKSANPVQLGTLAHYAKTAGYVDSVEFTPTVNFEVEGDAVVDLLRPPSFAGELCDWINSQCLYPRENLAVAATLVAISNLAGMRYRDELDGMTPNLIAFGVAGSGSGKESVLKAFSEIMHVAGLSPATYGAFKSEQELYRNLLRHQAAYYSVDELGIQLAKIKNAMKRGGASYLEGLLGAVMSVYSKADSFLQITGDLKEDIRSELLKECAAVAKAIDSGKGGMSAERKLERIERQLETIDQGIENPYLSIIGYTTGVTFDELFDFEQATNGFLSRAMIFKELENNPRRKPNFKKAPMPEHLKTTLQNLYCMGCFDMIDNERIEYRHEKSSIPTNEAAAKLLDDAYNDFWELAEQHKNQTGLEAIPRRGYEMASKVSLILAIPEGIRTEEHVRWAVALAKKDINAKLALAHTNSANDEGDRLAAKIMSLFEDGHEETLGVIRNRCRSFEKAQVDVVVEKLVEAGHLKKTEYETKSKKQKIVVKYSLKS